MASPSATSQALTCVVVVLGSRLRQKKEEAAVASAHGTACTPALTVCDSPTQPHAAAVSCRKPDAGALAWAHQVPQAELPDKTQDALWNLIFRYAKNHVQYTRPKVWPPYTRGTATPASQSP